MPVIPARWEPEAGKIMVETAQGKNHKTLPEK
jgi:hypothetical protein